MTEATPCGTGHPPDRRDDDGDAASCCKRRQIVRRTTIARASSCWCCWRSAPARTVFSRMANARALEAGAAEHATQYVKTTLPKHGGSRPDAGAAGHAAGLRAVADRGARQRLPEALDQGHRQPRREGRAARRDRDARDRPAAVAGHRRARSRRPPSLELAKSTVERWEALRKKDVVSQQELDERRSAARAGAAPTSRRPTPTCSGCARLKASSAWSRRSPASSRGATSTSAT